MDPQEKNCPGNGKFTRRSFLMAGSAMVAGTSLASLPSNLRAEQEEEVPSISGFRTLGRTGFKVSDISMGCGMISEANVVRYAYDHGINYFDVAEVYGNGDSETKIGETMPHMDRGKIFITTKLDIGDDDTENTLVERFGKCLERMKTDYADALYIHGTNFKSAIDNAAFHAAVARLKADGRLKYAGISSHGPRGNNPEEDSMDTVLCAAAEDGRFDLMLLSYNFMNSEEGGRVLASCEKNNVGTTAMKTVPGYLELEPFDPENPTGDYLDYIERSEAQGTAREVAIQRIVAWLESQEGVSEQIKPFADKYGIKTQEELQKTCIQWVLKDKRMHTVCVSTPDFESLDACLPLSGTKLSVAGEMFLRDYHLAMNNRYCRHGCTTCVALCPEQVPVSTIMRYSYYFTRQGREKHAMAKYAALAGKDAGKCLACAAPCTGACPHGVAIQANMFKAHSLLTLA
jgi:uncharacterized protein